MENRLAITRVALELLCKGGIRMKTVALLSAMILLPACSNRSDDIGDVSTGHPNADVAYSALHFTAVVKNVVAWNPTGNHETFSVEDDPRFILFLHIESTDRDVYQFQVDRDVDFLIANPQTRFGERASQVIGKTYTFSLEEMTPWDSRRGRRFRNLRIES